MYFMFLALGLGFIVLSLAFGTLLDADFGSALSFLKPTLIAIFLGVTGGLGLLLTPILGDFGGDGLLGFLNIVLFISVSGGLFIAALVNRFVIIPLRNAQNTSAFHIQDTIGIEAKVVSKIPQGGYGKIQYNISGSIVSSPAKSEDGNEILHGECVEIIYIEQNTYYVRRIAPIQRR